MHTIIIPGLYAGMELAPLIRAMTVAKASQGQSLHLSG